MDHRQGSSTLYRICGSNCSSDGCVLPGRPLVSVAGSVLGAHVDVNRYAVDPECRAAHFRAVCRGDRGRSSSWRSHRRLLPRKRLGVW